MTSVPEGETAGCLEFHELPTVDIEVHHEARLPGPAHPPTAPNELPVPGIREEWWRACLAGAAAALMAAGITTGLLLRAGGAPVERTAADSWPLPSAAPLSIAPAPAVLAGGLALAQSTDAAVAQSQSLAAVLSNAEQFFAASAPGVAAVYRRPGAPDAETGDSGTGDPGADAAKFLSFVGIDAVLADPGGRLDAYLRSVADGHAGATFRLVPAGAGSIGECVSFLDGDGRESECGWATASTVGVLDAPATDYSIGQLAGLMRRARPDLERA